MNQMWGADLGAMRQLAKDMSSASDTVREIEPALTPLITSGIWQGPDHQQFEADWIEWIAPGLVGAADFLAANADKLRANADQQEAASTDGGGVGGPALGGNVGFNSGGTGSDEENIENRRNWVPLPSNEADVESDDALSLGNVSQGNVGDCWFLAPLMAVADDNPSLIRDNLTHNDNDTWTVTLYHKGKPEEYVVGPIVSPDAATNNDYSPNYASIYELALIEYFKEHEGGNGKYADIWNDSPEKAFKIITGEDYDHRSLGGFFDSALSFDELSKMCSRGPVVLGSNKVGEDAEWWENLLFTETRDDDIVPNHAYVVTDVERGANGHGYVLTVVNPWGPDANKPQYLALSDRDIEANFEYISYLPEEK